MEIPKGSAPAIGASAVKAQLIRAAAEAILLDEDAAVGIACSEPGKFVQNVRHIYKQEGFRFSDDDLRDIHETVRRLVARKGLLNRVLTPEIVEQRRRQGQVDRLISKELRRIRESGPRIVTTTPSGTVSEN